jgi:hypothetical protein
LFNSPTTHFTKSFSSPKNPPTTFQYMSNRTILVTGDLVVDCHLYGGVKIDATSFSEPGTKYIERPGGAALSAALLRASADAKGLAWDKVEKSWQEANKKRSEKKQPALPRPDDHPETRPASIFSSRLGLDDTNLASTLPSNLQSYGVWTPHLAKKDSKDLVWRIKSYNHFGYGPSDAKKSVFCFKLNASPATEPAALTLIDDGGILFRHGVCQGVWPDFSKELNGNYVLKMSRPLCRGDLWSALAPVMARLTVIVSAADLRREDAQINTRLSWEQCVSDTINALDTLPNARDLLRAAHVIVNFGSAGALWVERGLDKNSPTYRLFFDAERFEGDYSHQFEGTAYGFQTSLATGIAHHLMLHQLALQEPAPKAGDKPGPLADYKIYAKAIQSGIAAGLNARRKLLELGHGLVGKSEPGFPVNDLGQLIAETPTGYASVIVSPKLFRSGVCQWTILAQSESTAMAGGKTTTPLFGLAELTARYGPAAALSDVPALHMGNLFTADRSEIESLRTIDALINSYESVKVQKKPLSIGVFGPPGAGKSFAVKILSEAILGSKIPFIEFNLSQFKNPEELIGAFHRVRDAVLKGVTPVAFWDEFDSQKYKWLQYLLAPMQDGAFQEGQVTHPIGKCIFIFAGGTSPTIELFGVKEPQEPTEKELQPLLPEIRDYRLRKFQEQSEQYRDYKLLKGPDFVSRLHGFLNVLGPNPRTGNDCIDITWPIRRALILRGILRLKEKAVLNMDTGLLQALLGVSNYHHGARSFEKILDTLSHGTCHGRLTRSALPPMPLLARETNAEHFHSLLEQGYAFRNHPDLEDLAAAIHSTFLDNAEKSKIAAEQKANPSVQWTIDPSIKKSYNDLCEDSKASNRAAAQRIPDHLALIGYVIKPQEPGDDDAWKAALAAAIDKHLDRLAKSEHLGWCSERMANGWTYGKPRNNDLKHHPLLVPWAQLTLSDQDKDRSSVRSIPGWLEIAKFKAVPVPTPK